MPPAPISRSSTYLPKIWGNIARLALTLAAAGGCAPESPELETRTIRVYSLPGCPAPDSASVELEALGAFSATNLTAEVLPSGSAGRELRFPPGTRAIAAASEGAAGRFIGYGQARESGDVSIALWPEAAACVVFDEAALSGFPSRGGGQALGFAPNLGLVLAAGGNDPTSSAVVGALTFDVGRGSAHAVDASQRHVLGEPRAFASVTEFDGKMLVAGGENPIHNVPEEERVLRGTAEVYDPASQRFEIDLVSLREPRTRHAALVLPSGETLLIGGRGTFGSALTTLEVVTPATRSSSVGLAPLSFGRIEPVALQLSDGRIFVGGGYDGDGQPVRALEWLQPDGDGNDALSEDPPLPPRFDRAFVAMPGGAVLAAGGCATRAPQSAADCDSDAWWIAADGSAEPVDLPGPAQAPFLVPGSDGAPWLFSDGEAYRFNPFRARFEPARSALSALPPPGLTPPLGVAPDHFFWISDDEPPALLGVRAGTRDIYARDVALVQSTQSFDPSWPRHLAPDRAPGGRLTFDGALHFQGPAIGVMITDALFDDLELSIDVGGGTLPLIAMGDRTLGDELCAFPVGEVSERETLTALRVGDRVTLTRQGQSITCPLAPGPLAVGLASPGEPSTVYAVEVARR